MGKVRRDCLAVFLLIQALPGPSVHLFITILTPLDRQWPMIGKSHSKVHWIIVFFMLFLMVSNGRLNGNRLSPKFTKQPPLRKADWPLITF